MCAPPLSPFADKLPWLDWGEMKVIPVIWGRLMIGLLPTHDIQLSHLSSKPGAVLVD